MTISHIPDKQAKKSCILHPYFGASWFPGSRKIPNPIKIFFVFPNPAPYFGQIPDPENTLPDPVISTISNIWRTGRRTVMHVDIGA